MKSIKKDPRLECTLSNYKLQIIHKEFRRVAVKFVIIIIINTCIFMKLTKAYFYIVILYFILLKLYLLKVSGHVSRKNQ